MATYQNVDVFMEPLDPLEVRVDGVVAGIRLDETLGLVPGACCRDVGRVH